MPNISSKELTALEDQLNYEQVMVKKYTTMANQCSDTQIKTMCQQIATKHQGHFDRLITYLQ